MDPRDIVLSGPLTLSRAAELLESVQASGLTGELYCSSADASGQIWFKNGRPIDAESGSTSGEEAFFRLLSLTDAQFEFRQRLVERERRLDRDIAAAARQWLLRAEAWRRSVERVPSLLTPLRRDMDAVAGLALTADERTLVELFDGVRNIVEVIELSGLDAVACLERIAEFYEQGLLTAPPSAQYTVPPPPVDSARRESVRSFPAAGDLSAPDDAPPPSQSALNVLAARPAQRFMGRYELICRIGSGGMGTVYLGRLFGEGGFRRLVAVKLLKTKGDPQALSLFLQEARIAARILHPNVVSVIDVGDHGAQPYMVMDYVEGASLAYLLKRSPRERSLRILLPIALDALSGLHAAHTLLDDYDRPLDLVHGDVSPENLLVGIDGTCRLTDFGVARARGLERFKTRGKPGYIAPEQIDGATVDRRADVFCMGIVLWNALTGVQLFHAETIEQTLENVRRKPIPPPSTVGLRPPAELDAICLRALERDPSRRYQTAEDMAADLERVAERLGVATEREVARWVSAAVGEELKLRRLTLLDESRRARSLTQSDPMASAGPLSRPTSEKPRELDRTAVLEQDLSRTIVLPRHDRPRQIALGAAIVVALALVLIAFIWPNTLRGLALDGDNYQLPANLRTELEPFREPPDPSAPDASAARREPAPEPAVTASAAAPVVLPVATETSGQVLPHATDEGGGDRPSPRATQGAP